MSLYESVTCPAVSSLFYLHLPVHREKGRWRSCGRRKTQTLHLVLRLVHPWDLSMYGGMTMALLRSGADMASRPHLWAAQGSRCTVPRFCGQVPDSKGVCAGSIWQGGQGVGWDNLLFCSQQQQNTLLQDSVARGDTCQSRGQHQMASVKSSPDSHRWQLGVPLGRW